jgi:hypothetical protein
MNALMLTLLLAQTPEVVASPERSTGNMGRPAGSRSDTSFAFL